MSIVPVRGVGGVGVITDRSPQELPLNGFTKAQNIRFANGRVSRYGVFKFLNDSYDYGLKTPVGVLNSGPNATDGYVTTVFSDGSMEEVLGDNTFDVTPAGTLGSNFDQITSCILGGVHYVNRASDVPVYRGTGGGGVFTQSANWGANDRCLSMRAYKDFIVALNVTKSGIAYPGMVKWSDAVPAGTADPVWTGGLSGENVLNDMTGPIKDGLALGSSFIIYGESETYRMDFIDAPLVFEWNKLFPKNGAISQNCVVEVDNVHYVFGTTDIYRHDGTLKQSISQGRVTATVFKELDVELKDRCFVYHDQIKNEIGFCYPSTHDDCEWSLDQITEGCNRAAVFNYVDNTWTFVDLPAIVGYALNSPSATSTWEDFPVDDEWDENSNAWGAYGGQKPQTILVAGAGNPELNVTGTAYFVDDLVGGRLASTVDTSILWPWVGETTLNDLDELNTNIYGRKLVRSLHPQIEVFASTDTISVEVGSSTRVSRGTTWGRLLEMSPWYDDKYDCLVADRYIAVRLSGTGDFTYTGYDLDIQKLSET